MKFTDDILNQAKNTDLREYLLSRGENVVRIGSEYRLKLGKDDTSIRIKGNRFCAFKDDKSGNTVDFLIHHYGMTFVQAVKELTDGGGSTPPPKAPQPTNTAKEIIPFTITKGDNIKRAMAYLMQKRKISYETIKLCLERHILSQDVHGNAVFKWLNPNGEVVGAELKGTTDKPFRGIAPNSATGYGFTIKMGENPQKALFFESSIDLLSYIDLFGKSLTSHILTAMGGLKEQVIIDTMARTSITAENVYLCVDADTAGTDFIKKVQAKHKIKYHLPKKGKDWNEQLRGF